MQYHLLYHPDIAGEDLRDIPKNIKKRLRKAIEERLGSNPEKYGEPLKRGLKGYRKLRVRDYRVIYKVEKKTVIILKIGHRKEVYQRHSSRFS